MGQYVITHTNGQIYNTLSEGGLDSKLGISLIGQNYHNYGQLIANNFLNLLEHQASGSQPPNPIAGQLWWNTTTKLLSVFDGEKFKPCSSSAVGSVPSNPLNGDQWFDTASNQLKVFDGTDWIVIGPAYTKGQGFSGVATTTLYDNSSTGHIVSELRSNDNLVAIINDGAAFTASPAISGITTVGTGITLIPNASLTGTSLNSTQLGGVGASSYVTKNAASTTLAGSLVVQGFGGISTNNIVVVNNTISSNNGSLGLISGNVTLLVSGDTGTITSSVEPTSNSSVATKRYVDTIVSSGGGAATSYVDSQINALIDNAPLDTLKKLSAAINNDLNYFSNVNAALSFKANISDIVSNPIFNGITTSGNILPTTNNLIDIGSASYSFRKIYGVAVSSQYADLAEIYTSDAPHPPGTVVVFGGTKEVTTSDQYCDSRVAGVISTAPSYLMDDKKLGVAVALTGRVPCKMIGPVKKGDIIVQSQFSGIAMSLSKKEDWKPGCVIGKCLENNNETEIRTVMISVGRF